jgi:hypothetical protein
LAELVEAHFFFFIPAENQEVAFDKLRQAGIVGG